LELSREERFGHVYRQFFSHYEKGTPRTMSGLEPNEIPLQFEFELSRKMYELAMTPQLLLMRGGISSPSFVQLGPAFESGSPWWYIEVDGYGSKHHQVMQGLPEANSVVVRPQTLFNTSFAKDLVSYFDKLGVPRGVHKSSYQFTVGLPLAKLPALLRRATSARRFLPGAERLCRERNCSEGYTGFVLLASLVLHQAVSCPACGFPKRCQSPWLLRTHFGDIAQTLPAHERANFTSDVLHVWGGNPDLPLYKKGIMDYLHFPEMAEMSGMVQSRMGSNNVTQELPVEVGGLLELAEDMLKQKHREGIDHQLRGRKCSLNGPARPDGERWQAPSARQWLEAASLGQDLMSDHDSPASKASLSHTLWRSMGNWRLSAAEPRIFLECRAPKSCLGAHDPKWRRLSYESMLLETARFVHALE